MNNELIPQEQPLVPEAVADMQSVWQDKAAFETALRGAMALSQSTLVPATYQRRPDNCLIALDMANRIGLTPLVVMQNLYVVNGRPSWSGQACKMLIENCGKFTQVETIYTGSKGTDSRGCFIRAIRRTTGETVEGVEVTIEMAKKEGWHDKSGSKWKTMPELMLAYRAAAFFARVHCPEALMGMSTVEEQEDISKRRTVEDVL
ncbi:MAG TPA: recombinase RecT [Anaerolineaceae bacterium]|nr:recombinase RecT [Clostridia bacterium]HPK26834.1 recombinase RecT [Anaerolineaceae bacterium]